jgi:RNase P protein component
MLAKKYRLPSSFFKKIEKEKITPILSYSGNFFSAKVYSSLFDYARFAVVVPANVFKKSVLRNKYRRMVYDLIRVSGLYKTKNIDCVLYLKKTIESTPPQLVESEINKVIKNVHNI